MTVTELELLYDKIWSERLCMVDCDELNCDYLLKFEKTLQTLTQQLNQESRTGWLWLL